MSFIERPDLEQLAQEWRAASAYRETAVKDYNDQQIESLTRRKDFFEKLALGAGATIAVLVSFVGSHNERLRPPWALRCSMLSLAVTIVSAMFRNFQFPNYMWAVRNKLWMEARLKEQRSRRKYTLAHPFVVDERGNTFDKAAFEARGKEVDSIAEEAIDRARRTEERYLWVWHKAELVCLLSVGAALVSLVWLVVVNF